ncbi:MAG: (Fe-S)-binding protein, partial [Gammaproteobacteria bacterium]|nr:(Fe-S)-binding protein [Gammaproteobacteria bacterium]
DRMFRVIRRGGGEFRLDHVLSRVTDGATTFLSQRTVLNARLWPSLAHALVAWGFTYYLLVNIGDVLEGFLPGFPFLGRGTVGNLYRLGADALSVAVLLGMTLLLLRRLLSGRRIFGFLPNTLLHPTAKHGIFRDSMIVAGFILLHVGARFAGASWRLAESGPDTWQPFAAATSRLWAGVSVQLMIAMQHAAFWAALGLILVFLPYFPSSKHIHLFFAPVNVLTKPVRRSIGALDPINFDDESATQYGAARLEHLSWPQLIDAYACIMCNRCQDVCPPHVTGKALSPSALEVNKRYCIIQTASALAKGEESSAMLIEAVIPEEAIWACTACGACVEICPVSDEPMRDILDIRRSRVLMDGAFPEALQNAYRGMERAANPWGISPDQRLDWCKDLNVPTVDQNAEPEILWWVGCAPATEARAQNSARAFVRILRAAHVDFAILGRRERCTGDAARRSGNEYLFSEMTRQNIQTLNEVHPKRIVTTCPHCLHVLKNEYPDFGGHYEVIHHTQFITELIRSRRLTLDPPGLQNVAFHDPCYLGRHNGVYEDPRAALRHAGAELIELPRRRNRSFCCGAGGAQMWKEEEPGRERVSTARFREVQDSGAKTLVVACPFCRVMLHDASSAAGGDIPVRDVAEIVAG